MNINECLVAMGQYFRMYASYECRNCAIKALHTPQLLYEVSEMLLTLSPGEAVNSRLS